TLPDVASASRREGLDSHAIAHECGHDDDPDEKKDDLRIDGVVDESGEAGERPASREGCAEHLDTNEHGSAEHRDDALPHDAAGRGRGWLRHLLILFFTRNLHEMVCRIKPYQ